MTVLVTGASGFVGPHVMATIPGCVTWDTQGVIDIRDAAAVAKAVARIRPDHVLHLASQSFVPESFHDPKGTLDVNFGGTFNLLQGLKAAGFKGRMVYVSSGDVYGRVPEDELPVAETRGPAPRNPYAVSKIAAEALCYQWSQTEKMAIMVARPFNHIGPGQSDRFVLPDVARQLVAISRGLAPPRLVLGDVDATRDYLDVFDVVAAYKLLLEKGENGAVYNICSGVERSVRECVMAMMGHLGIDAAIDQDPSRLRASEQKRMRGDATRLRQLGWLPRVPWDESIAALLRDWGVRLS